MRKKDWWVDVLLVVAIVALVLAIVLLLMQGLTEDRARKVLEEAQARSDLYRAATAPAVERPADNIVFYETPAPAEDMDAAGVTAP